MHLGSTIEIYREELVVRRLIELTCDASIKSCEPETTRLEPWSSPTLHGRLDLVKTIHLVIGGRPTRPPKSFLPQPRRARPLSHRPEEGFLYDTFRFLAFSAAEIPATDYVSLDEILGPLGTPVAAMCPATRSPMIRPQKAPDNDIRRNSCNYCKVKCASAMAFLHQRIYRNG
ncbi:hypothetical protein C4D60_Mb06t27790 [Musa balbisiana]|uniref:Uncharacterized protein n=1 Tax=Musa balbisiana TaxID=52838 RepID=A0A4S8IRA3_MUSBA|nr:hypothetical protein C4D60_Mb06t27790 [Musa balbisiana]